MNETANQELGQVPVRKLMARFAIPCIMSLLVSALYNIVDQIFVGRGVGYLGNGATCGLPRNCHHPGLCLGHR